MRYMLHEQTNCTAPSWSGGGYLCVISGWFCVDIYQFKLQQQQQNTFKKIRTDEDTLIYTLYSLQTNLSKCFVHHFFSLFCCSFLLLLFCLLFVSETISLHGVGIVFSNVFAAYLWKQDICDGDMCCVLFPPTTQPHPPFPLTVFK